MTLLPVTADLLKISNSIYTYKISGIILLYTRKLIDL